MKQFKTLAEQVEFLESHKKVIINQRSKVKKDLYDSNYYNIISCSKIKFAEDIAQSNHIYSQTQFKEWLSYFELDCRVSKYLMQNILEFERRINSRVAYCVSELFDKNKLSNFEKNDLMQIIQKSKAWSSLEAYHGQEAWMYITKMTFGEMKKLAFWLLKHKPEVYKRIVIGYPFIQKEMNKKDHQIRDKFNELNNLRNCLFHFTPLNIYVTYGKARSGKLKNSQRKKAINWIFNLKMNSGISNEKVYRQ